MCLPNHDLSAALRACHADFFQIWLGKTAVRKTRAGKELAMWSIFDHQLTSADFTWDVRYLVFDFNFFQFRIRPLHCFFQIRIKITYYRFPVDIAAFYSIQKAFQIDGKVHVYNHRKGFLHDVVDDFSQLGDKKVFILLCHIASGKNRRNRRRVGTRTANPLLL